ncbi:MAG: hypothetical protein J5965_13995 [Aeriscardovia sp.]|nr:hypothetical protein [Aeriscardovia sp.]
MNAHETPSTVKQQDDAHTPPPDDETPHQYDNTLRLTAPPYPPSRNGDVHVVSKNGNSSCTTRPQEAPPPYSVEIAYETQASHPAVHSPPHHDHDTTGERKLLAGTLTHAPPSAPSPQTRTHIGVPHPALSPNKTTDHATETVSPHSDCDALPTSDNVPDESASPP